MIDGWEWGYFPNTNFFDPDAYIGVSAIILTGTCAFIIIISMCVCVCDDVRTRIPNVLHITSHEWCHICVTDVTQKSFHVIFIDIYLLYHRGCAAAEGGQGCH